MCIADLARGVRQSLEGAATHLDLINELSPDAIRDEIGDDIEDAVVAAIQSAAGQQQEALRQRAQACGTLSLWRK
ncbi:MULTISPECIES: hypothetical protein [Mesorhizobium]|uniref:hypothetical protein n=1 Tax=Mesorhizobium TaxID=68287 RepID=UPI0003CEF445|nr:MULTISPECIES: hypothetical protein [Mesorhizobium]ESY66299.1 hypothetical protein X742_19405 [Mesorhizobium sp. LNHC232B00]WJI38566.1 hypothetical protein NL534_33220 [Mesorhizobium opportunistum]